MEWPILVNDIALYAEPLLRHIDDQLERYQSLTRFYDLLLPIRARRRHPRIELAVKTAIILDLLPALKSEDVRRP